jgi:hypothetical protein
MRSEEALGPDFNLSHYLEARQTSIDIVQEVAHALTPGITEVEAHELCKETFKRYGISKLWHPTKIRFGKNTLCTFREESAPGVRLGMGELFYLDIGPVVAGHEGDYGEGFRCGGGSDPLIAQSRELFNYTEQIWKSEKLTGPALYHRASTRAQEMGLYLDIRSGGHRLGDFPHAIHHKGKLIDFPTGPMPGVWILEIHLVDKERERAIFFEDVLGIEDLKDSLPNPL